MQLAIYSFLFVTIIIDLHPEEKHACIMLGGFNASIVENQPPKTDKTICI